MNTFLVMSPLQLLNAIEAKNSFGDKDNILIVLRHTSQGFPMSMFKRIIDESEWNQVHYLSTYDDERIERVNKLYWTYLSWLQRKRLDRLAAKLGSTDGLFVGLYRELMVRHFSNVLPYKKLYLVDDGTFTIETNSERKQPIPKRSLLRKLKALMIKLVMRYRADEAKQLTFFTVYDIVPRLGDDIIRNRYTHFRRHLADVPVSGEVLFLGQPLVLEGYVTEATYLHHLVQVKHYYRGRHFVYLPHSRERQADVVGIKALLGCEVRHYGLPVEIAISRANPRPLEVASFFSSALPNCQIMYGHSLIITSFYLAPKHLLAYHPFVEEVYEHFSARADTHFKVIWVEQPRLKARLASDLRNKVLDQN